LNGGGEFWASSIKRSARWRSLKERRCPLKSGNEKALGKHLVAVTIFGRWVRDLNDENIVS